MSRLPMFQGINVPAGLKARTLQDLERLKLMLTIEEYDAYINDLLAQIESLTGSVIIVAGPPAITDAYSHTEGKKIYIVFDKDMMNPSGEESAFTVSINGSPDTVSAIGYAGTDHRIFELTLATMTAIYIDTITVTYTPGTITAEDTTSLAAFTDHAVRNLSLLVPMGLTVSTPSQTYDYDQLSPEPESSALTIETTFNNVSATAEIV